MDLHGLVTGVVGVVNEEIAITLFTPNGTTITASGKRVTAYTQRDITGRVVSLGSQERALFEGMGKQNIERKVFINEAIEGIDREKGQPAYKMKFNGDMWVVSAVIDVYPTWSCVGVTKQVSS